MFLKFCSCFDTLITADFGFARYVVDAETKQRQLSQTYCGSAAYAAPEVSTFNFVNFYPQFLWLLTYKEIYGNFVMDNCAFISDNNTMTIFLLKI